MKKTLSNFILVLAMLTPALGFAGQHSGLGGTPPPSNPAPPEPTMFETFEQYLSSYYQWIREQMDQAAEQQRAVSEQK